MTGQATARQSLVELIEGYFHRLMVERAELRRELRALDEKIEKVEANLKELRRAD